MKHNKIKNISGQQVRKFRKQQGLSQAQLAAKCCRRGWKIHREIIEQIESQTRRVVDTELLLLAKILKINPENLIPKNFPKNSLRLGDFA